MRKLSPIENFLLSILAFHVIPLLPIAIELLVTGAISDKSLTITTAIYAAGMIASSQNVVLVGLYLVISLLETSLYGALTAREFNMGLAWHFTIVSLIFILVSQGAERFHIHLIKYRPFWS